MTTKRPASEIASRVLERLAATELDAKMKELLLKLRKGADASLTFGQLVKVLALLGGWKVEKYVGLVKADWNNSRGYFGEDEAAAKQAFEQMKKEESPASTNPQKGKKYVMNVGGFRDSSSQNHPFFTFDYDVFYGAECYRITSPEGKTFEQLPDSSWLGRGKIRYWLHGALPWLKKETSYLSQIGSVLGMEAHAPAVPRTRDGTGTCGACFRNIKISKMGNAQGLMALHGYERPGHGYIKGKCPGGAHQAFEISPTGTKMMLEYTENALKFTQKHLAALKEGPETIEEEGTWGARTVHQKGTPQYNRRIESAISKAESSLKFLEHEVKVYTYLIQHWEARELPQEGTPLVDYYTQAQRKVGH